MANSTTVCLTTLDELNDEKTAKRIPAIVYLSVSMVIGILGNLLVICVYFGPLKKNKKAHWTFIRSLAVSDFLVCVVVIPFELFQQTHQLTFHSAAACQLLRSVSVFSTIVSSFLVLFMSAHRVRLVCQPLKQQLTSRQAIYCIITIAVIGVVFAWPEAALSGISMETLQCNLTGYDCSFSDRFEDKWFTTAYSAVLQSIFLICIVGLIVMYSLFRALQGLSEEATFSYLSLASEEGLEKTAGTVDRIKARKSLQTFLCQTVKINTWEEAYKTYPEVSSKIEELVEVFSAYCHSLTTRPVCNNGEETQLSAPEEVDIDESVADTQPPAPESATQNFHIDIFIKSKGKEIVITEEAQRVIDFHKSILDKALTKVLPLEE
ncbi:CCKAR [Mytilus edulis]|uniref:CCKAR n=1 Tax=Mytilus edulis TaxID=6550 RepID=A0A8S3Q382_MYTED|nr:CCKAR [Mytilus edulis]